MIVKVTKVAYVTSDGVEHIDETTAVMHQAVIDATPEINEYIESLDNQPRFKQSIRTHIIGYLKFRAVHNTQESQHG